LSDTYKIGVAIVLSDGLSPALSMMSHRLLGVHRSVNQINSGFGRWRTALIGAAGVMAGSMMLRGLGAIAMHGDKFLDQQAKLKMLGLSNQQIAEATAKAWSNTRMAPGSGVAENLKGIGELYSITGFEEAIAISEKLAKVNQVLKNVGGKEGSDFTIARASELLGKFTDKASGKFSTEGFNKFLDIVTRSAIATHGKVLPADWLAFAKQAGPSAANLSEEGLLTATAVIQAMGGFRAGTAFQALNRQFAGGIMAQRVAKELLRIGVAKDGDFEIGRGGQVIAKTDAMKDMVTALQKDPLDAMVRVLLPALEAHGFKTPEQLSAEVFRMIGTGPAQRAVYELIRGRSQIEAERERNKGALGVNLGLSTLAGESPVAARSNAIAAFDNMLVALGNGVLQAAVPWMLAATDFFNRIGEFAASHPTAMKILGEGVAALGAAMLTAGVVALFAAIGPVGWLILGISALGIAISAFPEWFKKIGDITSKLNLGATFPILDAAIKVMRAAADVVTGGSSPAVAPPPAASPPGKQSSVGDVYLDGRKVGQIVSRNMVAMASGPINSAAYPDYTDNLAVGFG
jgi:hypothetical protein